MARTSMSDEDKESRRAVRDYLAALDASKPKRGRQRTPESIDAQIASIDEGFGSATPLKKLGLAQQRLDLVAERERLTSTVDVSALEAAFVEHASRYGEVKGISWAAWRDVGVSAKVLREAGITRKG